MQRPPALHLRCRPRPLPTPIPALAPATAPVRKYLAFFNRDCADLTNRAHAVIAEAAAASTRVRVIRIWVSGYADTSSTPRCDQVLSVRRAQAVAGELVRDGVSRSMIAIRGFGETNLLVPAGLGVREPRNRRVEIIVQ